MKTQMKSHATSIIEKMEDPKTPELNFEFIYKLTNESERGAILIGASKIEDYLKELILKVIPSHNKDYKNRLLDYPGPLSSFSGKIELTYAFRIIDEQVYNSLNTLRKIRNEAAHSDELFSLQENKKRLEKIYNFEDGFPEVVHNLALKHMIVMKKEVIRKAFAEKNLQEIDHEKLWNERFPNPEENESLQEKLTIWKLAYGLTFLCLKIEAIAEEYLIP